MKQKFLITGFLLVILSIFLMPMHQVAQNPGRNERVVDVDAAMVVRGGIAQYGETAMPSIGVGFNQQVFNHFRLGGMVNIAANPNECLPALDVEATYRFGDNNGFHVDVAILGGVGAISRSITERNDWFEYTRNRLVLSPEIGGRVEVAYTFGRIALGVYGEYKRSLSTKELTPEKGFVATAQSLEAHPLSFGAAASYRFTAKGVHRSGDNPWRCGAGFALGRDNKVSFELSKVSRHAYHWATVVGATFSQTLTGADRTSGVVRFGEQFLALGSTTWIIPEVLAQAGMTEVLSEVETHVTGDAGAELWRGNRVCRPAIEVGGEARLNLRLSGVTLFGGVEITYAIPFHGNNAGDIDNATYKVINQLSVYAKVGCMLTL